MAKKKTDDIKRVVNNRPSGERCALWISSGSDIMDLVVGCGLGYGYMSNEMVLYEADSQSGKTFFGNEVVASGYYKAQNKGIPFDWLYLDTESGNTFDSKSLYGIEVMSHNHADQVRPTTLQETFSASMSFMDTIDKDGCGVVVLDSIDGVMPEEDAELARDRVNAYERGKEFDNKSMGMSKAKYLSREFLPFIKERANAIDCLYIIISQYREAQGFHGPVKKIGNGKALPFFVDKRVKFKVLKKIIEKGHHIGNRIEVSTVKARGPHPYESGIFTVYFTMGIDNVGSNVDYLFDFLTATGEISKRNTTGVWDEGMEPMNRDELIAYIEENELENELTKRVRAKWEGGRNEALSAIQGRKRKYG